MFLLGAGALPLVGFSADAPAGKPLLTAGFVTDTHVTAEPESLERVRRAYRFFAAKGVDLIANLGDIANVFDREAYRLYARAREAAYPAGVRRPREIFVWANHDRINFTPGVYASSPEEAFAAAKPLLGVTHEMYDRIELGGFVFLVFPQHADMARFEKAVAAAVADHPTRPVFVLHHVPSKGTTYGSEASGSGRLTQILSRYPQAVHFSGHTHGSLRNELQIWQGGFTSVNFGCLSSWTGDFLGRTSSKKPCWDCAYLLFYSDRLVIRRFSLFDGNEISPDDPWTLVWGNLESYRPAVRARAERAPLFPPDARLALVPDAAPMLSLTVRIPASDASRTTLGYRLSVAKETPAGWETLALREICGDFWREASVPPAKVLVDRLPAAFFEPGARYRLEATPYGFFGSSGKGLAETFVAPPLAAAEIVCDVADGLPLLHGGERWRLPEAVQRLPAKTPLRLIVDAESDRRREASLNFRMECFPKKEPLCAWVVCEPGRVKRRYVLEFDRGTGTQPVFLSPTFSPRASTLRLLHVRIERR